MTTDEQETSSKSPAVPEFSVILSCYNEENNIDEFHARLSKTMESMGRSYEMIFVNDASTDRTFAKLESIFEKDEHVTVIDLFTNCGQPAAMTAGFTHARGEKFVFIDCDLQLDPEEVPMLVEEYDKGYDLVSGYRKKRKDRLSRVVFSIILNLILRKACRVKLRDFGCNFNIVNGRIFRGGEYGAFKPFRPIYVVSSVQRYSEVPVSHHPPKYGKSGWSFPRLAIYAMDNLFGIFQRPFITMSGVCFLLALLLSIVVPLNWLLPFSVLAKIVRYLFCDLNVFSLLLIVGMLFAVGEFVTRNYMVSQQHPAYIIRTILRRPGPEA